MRAQWGQQNNHNTDNSTNIGKILGWSKNLGD